MKTSYYFLSAVSVIFTLFPNNQVFCQQPVKAFNLGEKMDQVTEVKLSDFASDISYIPLELTAKSLLDAVQCIAVADDRLIVSTRKNLLKVFDLKGKYLNDIGAIGKGPGEYIDVKAVYWDSKAKEVIVWNHMKTDLNFYTIGGKFIRSFHIPYPAQELFRLQNGSFIGGLVFPVQMGPKSSRYFLFNTDGMVEPLLASSAKPDTRVPGGFHMPVFCSLGNKDLFLPILSDTIFSVSGKKLSACYVLHAPGKIMPEYVYYGMGNMDQSNFMIVSSIFSLNDHSLAISCKYQKQHRIAVINTVTGKISVCKDLITNDIDGGAPLFNVLTKYNGYLYISYEAIGLITSKEKGMLNKPNNKFQKLLSGLTADSNPVIVKIKTKEN